MKKGTEDKKKLAIAGSLGVVAVLCLGYLIYDNFLSSGPTPAAAPAAPVIRDATPNAGGGGNAPRRAVASNGNAAKKVGTTTAQLDPTLHMEAMHAAETLEYSGSGRNIFSMSSVPVSAVTTNIPKPIASARPAAPVNLPPPGPPPPPPINLRFFGIATRANGVRQAFLLQGDDVFLASAGDIVARRYKVQSISANSAVVQDMSNNNQQTLPLITQ